MIEKQGMLLHLVEHALRKRTVVGAFSTGGFPLQVLCLTVTEVVPGDIAPPALLPAYQCVFPPGPQVNIDQDW